MVTKRFSPELFKKNDAIARKLATEYFSVVKGFQVENNPDKFGPDLIVRCGEFWSYVECEIKQAWKTDSFPYDTIQFPERKKKFVKDGTPIIFFMINAKKTMALLVDGPCVVNSPLVEVPNKYVYKGERFFQVPKGLATFVRLKV